MFTMPAPNTSTCDEQDRSEPGGSAALRGFRKRWAQQSSASGAHSSVDGENSDFGFEQVGNVQLEDVSNSMDIPIMDL